MKSGDRLQAAVEELAERAVPGVVALIAEDGAIRQVACAGWADLQRRAPVTAETVQLWFSMTKIVTATAAMQLVERGLLDLDQRVDHFVAEFPRPRPGWPEVRVRHLLSHSSGLANPLPIRWVHPADQEGREPRAFALELLRRNARLRFEAGSQASYSNLGYIVLGEVIASAAGMSYEDYVAAEILEPLSMTRTGFRWDGADQDVATGYHPRFSPTTPIFRALLPPGIVGSKVGRFISFNRFYVDGAAYGGLVGSAGDAGRFMAVHLNGGELEGVRLISAESVRTMQTIHATGRKMDVGFGWFRRGSRRSGDELHLEHLGGGGGFWNMMRIYPERRVGVLSMGNVTGYDHERVALAAVGPP